MAHSANGSENWRTMVAGIWQELGLPPSSIDRLRVTGDQTLPSCFPVTDLAVATIGCACLAVSELLDLVGKSPCVSVDRRLSSLWFGWSISPVGWTMPAPWDPLAGDYRTTDGWIRLHTNAPHHRAAALKALSCEVTREAVAVAVGRWPGDELVAAIVDAGGCAATLRTGDAWRRHPQGVAVSAEPVVASASLATVAAGGWRPQAGRPLAGLRVLDLTRVLAGPVATRFLAGFGADVLRVDPPGWDEPGVIPEVTLGKRCIRLDLREAADREVFERLVAGADILVHGYRSGALEGLGYDPDALQTLRPGLIDISLNAYGHSGPWSARRGFDSLVQMSSGIASAGMDWRHADRPVPLPVQALDHATGYLMAAAALSGLMARLSEGKVVRSRLSLARTAKLLMDHQTGAEGTDFVPPGPADLADGTEMTSWGPARRVIVPATVETCPMVWDRPATALGSGVADWLI